MLNELPKSGIGISRNKRRVFSTGFLAISTINNEDNQYFSFDYIVFLHFNQMNYGHRYTNHR